jgi:hypothetical protein
MKNALEFSLTISSRPTRTWGVQKMHGAIFSRPTRTWGVQKMHGAIFSRPTRQGLFLQSYCISSIHGGQTWGVQKMHGAIFSRPTRQGFFLQACRDQRDRSCSTVVQGFSVIAPCITLISYIHVVIPLVERQ